MDAVGFIDIVNRDDVGMIQSGSGLGFLREARSALGISELIRRQNFDRHKAIEACVPGLIDHTHPAQFLEDLVVRNNASKHGPLPLSKESAESWLLGQF